MSAELIRESQELPRDHAILALDRMTWNQATELMDEVGPYIGMIKANSIAQRQGWDHANGVAHSFNMELMGDPKYHDTGRTMEDHLYEHTMSGSRFITLHAQEGVANMQSAVKGRNAGRKELEEEKGFGYPLVGTLLGITILTGVSEEEAQRKYGKSVSEMVKEYALDARTAGLEGTVSSGHELTMLQEDPRTRGMLKVIPGIVLDNSGPLPEGQQRVMTVYDAVKNGADFVVLGSAVTKADDPVAAAQEANEQIEAGLRDRAA